MAINDNVNVAHKVHWPHRHDPLCPNARTCPGCGAQLPTQHFPTYPYTPTWRDYNTQTVTVDHRVHYPPNAIYC